MRIFTKLYWREVFSLEMILKTTLQTIIGTVLVAAFFMLASDFIFKATDLNGRWDLILKPVDAERAINRCVDIRYTVLFTQNGLDIIASGEKREDILSIDEDCKDVDGKEDIPRHYPPGKGTKVEMAGFLSKGYIVADMLTLSMYEGKDKDRFTIGKLKVKNKDLLEGAYESNISDAKGKMVLKRKRPFMILDD